MTLTFLVLGCGRDPIMTPSETGSPPANTADTGTLPPSPPPTEGDALQAWLDAGSYLGWPSEPEVHDGAGPHFGQVRVFVNPALADSLVAGGPHPAEAAAVKELWGDGGELGGFSVMVKTETDSDGGAGWYWFERYDGATYADGWGVSLCSGCHAGGDDFVLTPWPP